MSPSWCSAITSEPTGGFPHGWGYGPSYGPDAPPPGFPPTPAPAAPARPPATLWDRFKTRFSEAPVTVTIAVGTTAVWLLHLALLQWAGVNTDLTLGDNGMGIHGQWWRLVTPMVVHFGIIHIGLNMLVLWQIGPPVEKVLGRWLYLGSYVACGIAGSVLSDAALGATALSGGASGAIVGVVGILVGNTAVLAWTEKRGRETRQRWRFNPRVARSLGIQIVVWIAFSSIAIPQIDNWAHVGGGIAGLVIGGAVAWVRTQPPGDVPLQG